MKRIWLIPIILLAISIRAQERNGDSRILQLTNPGVKADLTVNHSRGRCDIIGYNGNSVILKAWNRQGAGDESVLDRIDLSEANNRVSLFVQSDETIDIELRIPRQCDIRIEKGEGATTARYIQGEISVTQQNGNIEVTHLSGAAVLNTVDGDISVRFSEISPRIPMAITSLSGDIDLVMPEAAVSLKLRSDEGAVRSEFPLTAAAGSEADPGIGKSYHTAQVGGGGAEMLVRTVQGNIRIRKANL